MYIFRQMLYLIRILCEYIMPNKLLLMFEIFLKYI